LSKGFVEEDRPHVVRASESSTSPSTT